MPTQMEPPGGRGLGSGSRLLQPANRTSGGYVHYAATGFQLFQIAIGTLSRKKPILTSIAIAIPIPTFTNRIT